MSEQAKFTEHTTDGITIWQAGDVEADNPDGTIEIDLRKYLLARELILKGAKLVVHIY